MDQKNILILYYCTGNKLAQMARLIARGVDSVEGVEAKLRTVPPISAAQQVDSTPPSEGASYASLQDVRECAGLIMGSPAHFGNMAAPLKHFIDQTTGLWLEGAMVDKPAAVFTSSSSSHGGNETTLLSMLLPLMHHGMVLCGIPYTEPALSSTQGGGTPYGASHVSGHNSSRDICDDETQLCKALGQRVASMALTLQQK